MVDRGELTSSAGMYELAGRVGGRRRAQDWSLNPRLQRWSGEWRLAAVTTNARSRDRARRVARRDAAAAHGRASRGDVDPARQPAARLGAGGRLGCRATGSARGGPGGRTTTRRRWPPRCSMRPVGPRGADRLRTRLDRVTAGLDDAPDSRLADAFVAGAAALAHVRADPLLPAALGPSTEAGDALRAAYRAYEAEFSGALRGMVPRARLVSVRDGHRSRRSSRRCRAASARRRRSSAPDPPRPRARLAAPRHPGARARGDRRARSRRADRRDVSRRSSPISPATAKARPCSCAATWTRCRCRRTRASSSRARSTERCTRAGTTRTLRCSSARRGCSPTGARRCRERCASCSSPARRASTARAT